MFRSPSNWMSVSTVHQPAPNIKAYHMPPRITKPGDEVEFFGLVGNSSKYTSWEALVSIHRSRNAVTDTLSRAQGMYKVGFRGKMAVKLLVNAQSSYFVLLNQAALRPVSINSGSNGYNNAPQLN